MKKVLAALIPIGALLLMYVGFAGANDALTVVGALLWLDFWGGRVGGLILQVTYARLVRKAEETE